MTPPRNQLDPFENHWDSLHFQCPALMWNSARQRHPGGQLENLTVIGESSKTVGYSDILRSRAAWNKMKYSGGTFPLVRLWSELRTIPTENLQKLLENIVFLSILAGTRSAARNLGIPQICCGKKTAARDLHDMLPQS